MATNYNAVKKLNQAKAQRQQELAQAYEELGGSNPAYKPIQTNNVVANHQRMTATIPQLEKAVMSAYEGNDSYVAGKAAPQRQQNLGQVFNRSTLTERSGGGGHHSFDSTKNLNLDSVFKALQPNAQKPGSLANIPDYSEARQDYASLYNDLKNADFERRIQQARLDMPELLETDMGYIRPNLTPEMEAAGITKDDLDRYLDAQAKADQIADITNLAENHPVVASAMAFPARPVEGAIGNIQQIADRVQGKPLSQSYSPSTIMRNTVTENIDSNLGRIAYGGANSIGDMAMSLLIGKLLGGNNNGAVSAITRSIMGTEKSNDTMNEAIERNLSPNQVLTEGVGSFLSTYLTEALPLERIAGGGSNILGTIIAEGGQEALEDIVDTLFDQATTISGGNVEKSELAQSYNAYRDMGLSDKDAKAQVLNDYWDQLKLDGVLGGITGGLMQGGTNIAQGRNVFTGNLPTLNNETNTEANTDTATAEAQTAEEETVVSEIEQLSKEVVENPSVEKYEAFVEAVDNAVEANPELQKEIGEIYNDVNSFYEENADSIPAVNNNIDNVNAEVDNVNENVDTSNAFPTNEEYYRQWAEDGLLGPDVTPENVTRQDIINANMYEENNAREDLINALANLGYDYLGGELTDQYNSKDSLFELDNNWDLSHDFLARGDFSPESFAQAFDEAVRANPNATVESIIRRAYEIEGKVPNENKIGGSGNTQYKSPTIANYIARATQNQMPEVQTEPEVRASRREINEAIRAAEGIKSKLAMVNERNARVLERRVEKAIERVRTTTGQEQIQAIADLNTMLDGVNNAMQYSTAGIPKRNVNRDSFENMRNVTNGRKIKVTPEMLNNVNVRTVTDLNNMTNTGTKNRIRFYAENTKNDSAVSLDSIWNEMVEQSGNELPMVMEGDQLQALIDYINEYKAGKNEEVNSVSWNDLESDFRSEGERQIDEIADALFDKIEDGIATKADWEEAYDAINDIQMKDRSLADKAYEVVTELSNAFREQTSNADVDPDINSAETWDDVEQIVDDMFDDDAEEITGEVPREHNMSSGVHNGRFKQSKFFTNTGDKILSEQEIKQHEIANDMLYEENSEKESMAEAYKRIEENGIDAETKRLMQKKGFTNADVDELMILWKQATEEANALDEAGQDSDEVWGYCANLFEKVKEETSRNAQALQAVAKWSRNNTPQGLLTQAASIINNYEDGYKKGRVDWHRDVRRNTKQARTLDADFMKSFLKEADNLYTGTWEDVKKLTDGYTIHITPNMLKALGIKKLGQLNAAVYTDTGNSIKFTTNPKDPKTGKPYKSLEQAYREIYEKASDRFLDPDTISETKMLQTLYQFITQKGRMVNLETRAARHTMANLGRMVNEQIPSSIAEKVTTFLMDNMLGNFRTLITRNAGGNIGFNLVEEFLRKPLSAAIDTQMAKKSGTRTVSGLTREGLQAWREGFADGIKQEIYDFKNDIQSARSGENTLDTAVANNRNNVFDIQQFVKTKDSNGLENGKTVTKHRSKLLKLYNKLVKTGLSVGDRPFYEATYKQTMAEYKKLYKEGKFGDLSLEEFNELSEMYAKLNALAAVYQDNTAMSEAFIGFKQALGKASEGLVGSDILSQFSMPFVKTPANIIERSIEYSPLGFVKNLVQSIRELKSVNVDPRSRQERIATELSRNIIGTALFAIGLGMAKAGSLTGGYDDDKDMRQAQKEAGMQEHALHTPIGDFDISWLPVLGNNLVSAAAAYDNYNNSNDSGLEALSRGATAGVASQFDTSALQGLQRVLGGAGTGYAKREDSNPVTNAKNAVLAGLTQFIPSLLRQGAAFGDEYQRNLMGVNNDDEYYFNSLRNTIPFLRETLQPRIGRTGEPLEQNAGQGQLGKFLSNFISPATWTVGTPDAVRDEAMRLYQSTGNTNAFQTTVELKDLRKDGHEPTAEEFAQYQQVAYSAMNQIASNFINSDYYQTLNDGEKETALGEIYSAIRTVEKLNIIDGDKSNLNGAAQAYDEGGEEGLINYIIARNTLNAQGRQNNPTNREEIIETLEQGGYDAVQQEVDHYNDLQDAGIDSYNLQVKYDHATSYIPSLTPSQFMETWDAIDSMENANDSVTQAEMLAYLNQNPGSYDLNTVMQYWNAYGNSWSKQPYFDEESGTWKCK